MSEQRTAASIAAELSAARRQLPDLEKKVTDLEAKRPEAERVGPDAILKLDKEMQRATAELNSARRRADDLDKDAAMAAALEIEQRRERQYETALASKHHATTLVLKVFRETHSSIEEAVAALRRATAAVVEANADRPAGREPIPLPADDDRLIAGEVLESQGLAVVRTRIGPEDARFWARLEPMQPHTKRSGEPAHARVAPPLEERVITPGAGGGPTVAQMPRANDPARPDESRGALNVAHHRPGHPSA